jgi:hypothetical protein
MDAKAGSYGGLGNEDMRGSGLVTKPGVVWPPIGA